MKKGFTLIELLAVIVILAVISLITVPMLLNVVEESRKGAFKATCNEIYDAYEKYQISEEINGDSNMDVIFDFNSDRTETEIIDGIKYEPMSKLSLKGELPKFGTYEIKDGKRELVVDNGKYTCVRNENREDILDGVVADNDLTEPVLRDIILSSTTSSIKVIVDGYEEDGLITKYYYQINEEEVIISDTNIYVFDNLNTKEEYEIKVYVENKSGLKSEVVSKKIETNEISGTTYEISEAPEGYEYSPSKILTVKYDKQNGLSYYLKTDVEVEVVSGIIEECGIDTLPGSCTSTSVTILEANKWYRTNLSTTNVIFRNNGNIYTTVNDGTNTSTMSTYNVSKIDSSEPKVEISVGNQKTDRVIVTAACSDLESGITKHEYSDGTNWYDGGLNSSYTITGLEDNKEYEFKVRCTNGSGLTNEISKSDSTLGITNPSIAYEKTPSTPVNGYLTSETIKVIYSNTNIESPSYFVKTTRKGTSSLSVSESCGSGDVPGTCTSITSTTILEENTWYKVSGNVNVTYNEYATSVGALYAMTYDGTNYSGASTGEISKITKEANYTVKHYQMNTDMTNYELIETETLTGTANYPITPNVKTYIGFISPNAETVTVSADGSTVVEYKYERKQAEVTFYRNTSESDTTTDKQTFIYGLYSQSISSKGWTRSGYTPMGWSSSANGTKVYDITNDIYPDMVNSFYPTTNLYLVWWKNPTYKEIGQTPTNGTWATSRTIQIIFNGTSVSNPKYYFKSTVGMAVSSDVVTAACGINTTPGTCTSTSVTTLEANTWYQTTSQTPSITFSSEGTVTAYMRDVSGRAISSTYNVENIDSTEPNVGLSISDEKTDRVTITATCSDAETGITKYEYSDGSKWYDGGLNSSYTITGLNANKEYEFKVRCTNGVNNSKEASTKDNTLGITNPSIAYDKTPSTPVNGYLTSETLKVTYSNSNIVSPQYFVKTTRKGVSSLSVSESCGSGDAPGTCTSITSTTTLSENIWYKVSGNVNVTYNEYATSTGTLYAMTYDGTNFSGSSTGEISKITKTANYTVKHYQMNTDMTNYTLTETETKTATANFTDTPAVKTYTGFISPSTETVTVSSDGSTVVEYRYARKQIEVTFYRNTSASDTTTAKQTFTYGVSGQTFSSKGWTRSGYTLGGWGDTNSGAYKYLLKSGLSDAWINSYSPTKNVYAVWIKNPTIAEASSEITSGYACATSRTIEITYTNTNMASPKYYFMSTVSATVPSGVVTAVCGTSTNPGTCTTSNVTTLVANTWYQTTSTTPSITFTKVGTLTASTTDGSSGVYASSTYQVTNVSDGTPTSPVITGGSSSWSNAAKTISISTASTGAGGVHHYQYCISTTSSSCNGTWTNLASGTTSVSISTNGTRYIFFRAIGNNGKEGIISASQTTMIDTSNPTVSVTVSGKVATFTITDNIGTVGYGVNQSTTSQPSYTSYATTSGTRTWTASAAGTYQVWVKDNAGRTATASFTIASSAFSYAATATSSTYTASAACSGGRTLSNGNCTYYYTSNSTQCGSTTNSCRTSGCGCETAASCANSSCTCAQYYSKATSACSVSGCSSWGSWSNYSCKGTSSVCQSSKGSNTNSTQYQCATVSGCGTGAMLQKRSCSSYTYSSCRHSSHGCETYNSCQNESACGCATYRYCQNSACGSTANSCTKTENNYRYYTCNSGDTLSGTTCTHITYSCPNGGTLNGTTCQL